MTGPSSVGGVVLAEVDHVLKTPAGNNLATGSGVAVIFGAPMLALIGLAPSQPWLTVILMAVYLVGLIIFMLKAKGGGKGKQGKAQKTAKQSE